MIENAQKDKANKPRTRTVVRDADFPPVVMGSEAKDTPRKRKPAPRRRPVEEAPRELVEAPQLVEEAPREVAPVEAPQLVEARTEEPSREVAPIERVQGLEPIPPKKADEIRVFRCVSPRRIRTSNLNVTHREPSASLVSSIEEHGVIEPVIVRPVERTNITDAHGERTVDLELVVGERRLGGALLALLSFIPVEIRQLSDREAFDLIVAENLEREDLSPMQEAMLCERHRDRFGRDLDEIAAHMGRKRRWVEQRLALCTLPEEGRALVHTGRMLLGVALEVVALPENLRAEAIKVVTAAERMPPFSIADARELLAPFSQRMSSAPFDVSDAQLVPAAGPCTTCPKRSGSQLSLLFDVAECVDRCLDRACWARKADAAWQARAAAAEEGGVHVLDTKEAGEVGTAARALLARHDERGLIDLDAHCDVAGDALVQPHHKAMEEAMRAHDQRAADEAEEALTRAEREAEGLTWRKVLGDDVKPSTLIRDTRSGRDVVVELVDKRDAIRALEARGVPLPPQLAAVIAPEDEGPDEAPRAGPDETPAAPTWLVDAHTTRLLVTRVAESVVPLAEKARPWANARLWRCVIRALAGLMPGPELAGVCARRGWKQARSKGETVRDVFEAHVATAADGVLRGLLVELCSSASHVHAIEIAEAFGLDVGALHKACEVAAKKASNASSRKSTRRGASA